MEFDVAGGVEGVFIPEGPFTIKALYICFIMDDISPNCSWVTKPDGLVVCCEDSVLMEGRRVC